MKTVYSVPKENLTPPLNGAPTISNRGRGYGNLKSLEKNEKYLSPKSLEYFSILKDILIRYVYKRTS
jgi:hypothetical protein